MRVLFTAALLMAACSPAPNRYEAVASAEDGLILWVLDNELGRVCVFGARGTAATPADTTSKDRDMLHGCTDIPDH